MEIWRRGNHLFQWSYTFTFLVSSFSLSYHILHTLCCSLIQLCPSLCDRMDWSTPGFPVLHYIFSLLKLMSIESMMPSNHLFLCCPLLLLPWIFPSIRVFSNESALHIRWPKDWSFSFRMSPFKEYSRLTSFGIDRFDLLAAQWTLKRESSPTPQFKSINSPALSFLYSPILTFIHDYRKNHSFDSMDLVDKVMSLLFKMLSRFVISFLPRRMYLLISWL